MANLASSLTLTTILSYDDTALTHRADDVDTSAAATFLVRVRGTITIRTVEAESETIDELRNGENYDLGGLLC
ncbi:hypothetical protein RRF57_001046 [Xylaria bambusicola]|uniref:Uncharacterized protein n=1 Tax=Xylaria bambusicola TaxID=326684 RepID=A0AAN7U4X5_9PEZI